MGNAPDGFRTVSCGLGGFASGIFQVSVSGGVRGGLPQLINCDSWPLAFGFCRFGRRMAGPIRGKRVKKHAQAETAEQGQKGEGGHEKHAGDEGVLNVQLRIGADQHHDGEAEEGGEDEPDGFSGVARHPWQAQCRDQGKCGKGDGELGRGQAKVPEDLADKGKRL